ncbi:uncharacterized protein LOC118202864 [Stegodyphus dumicola]|uniref:uncharacterized protein LOC118202864 n=1 Tax=Stegodyphus dumicola TaxID=202533 RepID=UPI0015AE7A34|nr:uncharacterized protein LOC118202864 [Stegodyphus dumicola]
MWVLFAIVSVLASAALGKDDICQKRIYEACDYDHDFVFPNNEKQFDEECSILLDESNCRLEYAIKCESDRLEEITEINEFLEDVCRKGSSLNEAIAPNVGCIKESIMNECSESTRRVHRNYREYLNTNGGEFSDKKLMCMSLASDAACAVNAVSVPCGNTVKNAVKQSIRRIDWMEQKNVCTRKLREEIAKDIPTIQISLSEKVILEELLLDI